MPVVASMMASDVSLEVPPTPTKTSPRCHAGSRHRLGLVSYDNNITVHTQPTDNLVVFEDVIDGSAHTYTHSDTCAPFANTHVIGVQT